MALDKMGEDNLEAKIEGNTLGESKLCQNVFYRVDFCGKKGYTLSEYKGENRMNFDETNAR